MASRGKQKGTAMAREEEKRKKRRTQKGEEGDLPRPETPLPACPSGRRGPRSTLSGRWSRTDCPLGCQRNPGSAHCGAGASVSCEKTRQRKASREERERKKRTPVQVKCKDVVDARRLDEARDQRRRDGDARLCLAVLPGVAVVRNDGGDALCGQGGGRGGGRMHGRKSACRRPLPQRRERGRDRRHLAGGTLEGVSDEAQLHQRVVDGGRGALDHKALLAAHILPDGHPALQWRKGERAGGT